MMTRLATLALLALVTGCTYEIQAPAGEAYDAQSIVLKTPRAITVTIDPSVPPGEKAAVLEAVAAWNRVLTCARLEPVVAPVTVGDRFGVRTVDDLSDCAGGELAPGTRVEGCANRLGIRILAGLPDTAHVAAHELGHMLGVQHTDDRASVMFPVDGAAPPSEADGAVACDALSKPPRLFR